jgi:hypothetical protein
MTPATNLRVLKRSRPKLTPGDVFILSPAPDRFLFGRVILADLPSGRAPMPTANLIYIYASDAPTPSPVPFDSLAPDNLLLPPEFINRKPWTMGYFQNIAHVPLRSPDLLSQHCFWDVTRKMYRDERGARLTRRSEPCGVWALGSYRILDDLISDALGIERVPE